MMNEKAQAASHSSFRIIIHRFLAERL